MSEEKQIEIISKIVKSYFASNNEYNDWYNNYDDTAVNFSIKFHPLKLKIKKNKGDFFDLSECTYEGLIDLKIDSISLEDDESIDIVYYQDDLPGYIWDSFLEELESKLLDLLPHVCMRFNLVFKD